MITVAVVCGKLGAGVGYRKLEKFDVGGIMRLSFIEYDQRQYVQQRRKSLSQYGRCRCRKLSILKTEDVGRLYMCLIKMMTRMGLGEKHKGLGYYLI